MSAAKEAAYKAGQLDAWMTTIDNMLKELAGDTFSYDAQSDPRYALAKEYAKQAMDAQMAESALLSGGYGNSYAAASGQQVYTDYMNDAVNDMEDRAYSMWSAERSDKYNQLGLAMQLENQEYTRAWNEEERDYNRDWNEKERDYNRDWNEKERDYNRDQDAKSDALYKAEVLAAYGNFDGYKALGYTDEEIASMQAAYDEQKNGGFANIYSKLAEVGAVNKEDALGILLANGYDPDYAEAIAAYYAGTYLPSVQSAAGSGDTPIIPPEYDYIGVIEIADDMKSQGKTYGEIVEMLETSCEAGLIDEYDLPRLKKQYR